MSSRAEFWGNAKAGWALSEAAMALTFGTDVVSYDVEAPQRPPSSGSYGILAPSGERETMPMPQDGAKG